jgi:Fe-S cluster assembly protein SufD
MTALSALALTHPQRAKAAALVERHGIPHRRVEEWKYSDLRSALGEAGMGALSAQALVGALPAGVEVWDLTRPDPPAWVKDNFARHAVVDYAGNAMRAASLALAGGGIALRVPAGKRIDDLLKLDFTGDGHVRALLVVEAGASVALVEGVGAADFRNVGFEIVLGEGARLDHLRINPALDKAILIEEAAVRMAAGAAYHGHLAGFGGRLTRMALDVAMEGVNSTVHLSGVAVLDGTRHSDVTTHVRHLAGDTKSEQLFKHAVAGRGHAVYQGKISVAPGANGSDSSQTAKALLLGERAEADLKPELEILADDVQCVHGAAVGDLDVESLFYLRSRGIPEAQARRLLLQAFLEEAVSDIAHDANREAAHVALQSALEKIS